MSEHHQPKPPDTSKLWEDESWGVLADSAAAWIFWTTFGGAVAFILAVIIWIFL